MARVCGNFSRHGRQYVAQKSTRTTLPRWLAMKFFSSSGETGSTLTDAEGVDAEGDWADVAVPVVSPADGCVGVVGAGAGTAEDVAGGSRAAHPKAPQALRAATHTNWSVAFGASSTGFLFDMVVRFLSIV